MPDRTRDQQLVTLATLLARAAARRRKLLAMLRQVDEHIRVHRKLLRDLTTPTADDVYAPPSCEDADPLLPPASPDQLAAPARSLEVR